jgi:imidazolonepropionase-like amidohydrolase
MNALQTLPSGAQLLRLAVEDKVAITGGNILDATGSPPRKGTLVIERGRIASITDAKAPIQGATRTIDATGLTVMPGLIDCHTHMNGQATADVYRRYLTPSIGVKLIRAGQDAATILASGFTSIRDIGKGFGIPLRRAVASGLIEGPRILGARGALTPLGGHGDWNIFPESFVREIEPRAFIVNGVSEIQRAVRRNFREGGDFIKMHLASGGVTNDAHDLNPVPNFSLEEVLAASAETHRFDATFSCHTVGRWAYEAAGEAGADTIEHGVLQFDKTTRHLFEKLLEIGTVFVPTFQIFYLTATEGDSWGVFKAGQEKAKSIVETHLRTVYEAYKLGIPIACGTDTNGRMGVGRSAIELEMLVKAGLPEMDAIAAATRVASRALGLEKEIGTLEPGKLADISMFRGDPLTNIKLLQKAENVAWVIQAPPSLWGKPSRSSSRRTA